MVAAVAVAGLVALAALAFALTRDDPEPVGRAAKPTPAATTAPASVRRPRRRFARAAGPALQSRPRRTGGSVARAARRAQRERERRRERRAAEQAAQAGEHSGGRRRRGADRDPGARGADRDADARRADGAPTPPPVLDDGTQEFGVEPQVRP